MLRRSGEIGKLNLRTVGIATLGVLAVAIAFFLLGRGSGAAPKEFETLDQSPRIYPDYTDTTIPPNLAPLNFDVCERADQIAVGAYNDQGELLAFFKGSEVRFSTKVWKTIVRGNIGRSVRFSVFAKDSSGWFKYRDFSITISADEIDRYLSYRLVGPGYEYFSDLALWTRDLESFNERALFRARLVNERTCVNCHTFQDRHTDNFFFHLRLVDGGTIFVQDGTEVSKRELKAVGLSGGCSYAAWRPNSKHVAFVSNKTEQVFHTKSLDRIDVLDSFGDLYLYDVERNLMTPIVPPGDETLECFPSWSQDGKTLYYCSAKNPGFKTLRTDSEARSTEAMYLVKNIRYDLKRVEYNEETGQFSAPELVFDAAGREQSALFPRLSPDGKLLIFTLTRYGCFPIWYRDSDIWSLDVASGETRRLDEINSPTEPDSYHSWSSSGKWMVFSSRRDDGSYTRLYFTHFDETTGKFSKPVMLPQKDPCETLVSKRSYNIPEFTVEPVRVSERKLLKYASGTPTIQAEVAR